MLEAALRVQRRGDNDLNSEFIENFGKFCGRICIGDQDIGLAQGCGRVADTPARSLREGLYKC